MYFYHYILSFLLKFLPRGEEDAVCNFLTLGTCTYEDEFLIKSYEVENKKILNFVLVI